MADAKTVRELIDYYVNLLIIQYNGKPKARATIEAYIKQIIGDGLVFDVRDAFNLDTAVGVQLDVIGKYVGIDRYFSYSDPQGYFRTPDWGENDPDLHLGGFVDYAEFESADQGNGTMNYNSVLTVHNKLNDDDFRALIKLKIIQNHSNHSHESIDDSMFMFFGYDVVPSSTGGMNMWYFVTEDMTDIIRAAMIKEVLPRPMGVGVGTVSYDPETPIFSMPSLSDVMTGTLSDVMTGFASLEDYDTKVGKTLSLRDIS